MFRLGRTVTIAALVGFAAVAVSTEEGVITPADSLVLDSIPKIPASIAEKTARYTNFRTATFRSWHPTRSEMLVLTRFGDANQVHLVRQPAGDRSQLTFFADRVTNAEFNPVTGAYFVFEKDTGGNERFQLYRYDMATGDVTLLTDGKARNDAIRFNRQGTRLAYASTRRNGQDFDLWVMDPANPKTDRMVMQAENPRWRPVAWMRDGKSIVVSERVSINESYLWLIDASTGSKRALTPRGGEKVSYADVHVSADDKGLYLTSDRGSEFLRLAYFDLATGTETALTSGIPWDVEELTVADDGKHVAFITNENGVSHLYILDTATKTFQPVQGLPSAVISELSWHANSRDLAFSLQSARTPTDVYAYNVSTGAVTRWTRSETGGLVTSALPEAQLVTWKTFDGKDISGFLYMPPAKFSGKRPVIVNVHGGPEGQSRPQFIGRNNYYLNELGVAVVYPNVRGSTGYGKTFLDADNGFHREDSYKDMAALFDWIKKDPRLDGDRILVTGGSYGGHMVLVAATHYADKIRASIDIVGISNLVTFLEHTEPYRRDARRVEYGDERDPKMRAYQESVAPMNRIKSITKPMLIVAGKNDPRVPITESEQIANAMKANGVPRWFLVANDEGHGYAKRKNIDFQFYVTVQFVENYLLN